MRVSPEPIRCREFSRYAAALRGAQSTSSIVNEAIRRLNSPDSSNGEKSSLAIALTIIGTSAAYEAIAMMLADPETPTWLRRRVVLFVTFSGNDAYTTEALDVIDDPNPLSNEPVDSEAQWFTRMNMAFALGQVGNAKARDGLIARLKSHKTEERVRSWCLAALWQLGTQALRVFCWVCCKVMKRR